jgi:DNA-binding XRE family transcriptional regulator
MADAYRKTIGHLTGEEIRQLRKKKNWSQLKLAEAIGVGIASIKRWEGGVVQTTSMDNLLRYFLVQSNCCVEFTGNRDFSVGRTKLAFDQFESSLGHKLLVEDDKFLYGAKYMFYADMVAYRELGKSITGATYAALPLGPQLNNYRDLAPAIIEADTTHVEPLTDTEKQIIANVAKKFPGDKDAFHASHKESVWKGLSPGALIGYSSAFKLKAI